MKHPERMQIIFLLSTPFKIINSVIAMVPIFMVYMCLAFYWFKECFCHYTMYSVCGMLSFYRKEDCRVYRCIINLTKTF